LTFVYRLVQCCEHSTHQKVLMHCDQLGCHNRQNGSSVCDHSCSLHLVLCRCGSTVRLSSCCRRVIANKR
jgi:hypothetical protein